MPVRNALPYLDAAVESILAQTFADFEFVILDDASTDGSTERLREWARKDRRIRLIEVQVNLGPAMSSDLVARAATAPIVARMDADDISYPERLAKQLEALREWPDVGVVGGLSEIIDHEGRLVRRAEPWRLMNESIFPPFGNGPMTYRRTLFERIGGFRKPCEYWEDIDLLIRMAGVTKVMVLPDALYQVRLSRTSTRVVSDPARVERAIDLAFRATDCIRAGRDYEQLLREPASGSRRLDPRVFVAIGSIVLWSGGRPRVFQRLIKSGKLSFDFRSAGALIWGAWASAAPAALRAFLRTIFMARNSYASVRLREKRPVLWSPEGLTGIARAGGSEAAAPSRSAPAAP